MTKLFLFALFLLNLFFSNALQAATEDYLSNYMNNVQKKIKRKWHPPKYPKSYLVTAQFELDLDGQILGDIRFKKTINDTKSMQAVKEAILNAAPFKKLDKKLVSQRPIIEFSFDYNVKYPDNVDNDGDLPIEIIKKKK